LSRGQDRREREVHRRGGLDAGGPASFVTSGSKGSNPQLRQEQMQGQCRHRIIAKRSAQGVDSGFGFSARQGRCTAPALNPSLEEMMVQHDARHRGTELDPSTVEHNGVRLDSELVAVIGVSGEAQATILRVGRLVVISRTKHHRADGVAPALQR
jgi:hypothetical protein